MTAMAFPFCRVLWGKEKDTITEPEQNLDP